MGHQESWVTSDTPEHFTELIDKIKNIVKNDAIPRTTINNINGKLEKSTEQEGLECWPVAVITTKKKIGKPVGRTKIKGYPVGTQFVLIQGERWQQRTPVNLLGDLLDKKWIPVDITYTEEMCPEDKIWDNLKNTSKNICENDYIKLQDWE
jgi:hypothetical protein